MSDGSVMTNLHAMLRTFVEHMDSIRASDLYLSADSPPVFRVDDAMYPGRVPLSAAEIVAMAESIMSSAQYQELRVTRELNVSFALRDDALCRVNLFWQRGTLGAVVRLVRTRPQALDELGHPGLLQKIALARRGLVLVVGTKGSGRSSTLAAMIDHRNAAEGGHILTIEEPIEVRHVNKQCIVTQREVGTDTASYGAALENAARQTPDLLFVDEIRNAQVMEAVLDFAASGRLCLSALHASSVREAIERILSFFPMARQAEIQMRLSQSLRAVIAQRLVPSTQGGRVGALEILVHTPSIKQLLRDGDIDGLHQAMEQDADEGCCTTDASLFALLCTGRIDEVEALRAAEDEPALRARIQRLREDQRAATTPLRLAPEVCVTAAAETSARANARAAK